LINNSLKVQDVSNNKTSIFFQQTPWRTVKMKIIRTAPFFISILILASCTSQKKNTVKISGPVIKGSLMEIYYPDGSLFGKGTFQKTSSEKTGEYIKHGQWKFFHENTSGKKIGMKGNFNHNKKEGVWQYYFLNGTKRSETIYKSGQLDGLQKNYTKSGLLFSETPYINGLIHGKKTEYYKNQKTKSETPYKKGKIAGTAKIWYESGKLYRESEYINSIKNGPSIEFYPNGKLKKSEFYKDGKLDGQWFEHYANGKKRITGQYRMLPGKNETKRENWEKTGTWTYFHQNGTPFMKGKYIKNKKQEKWKTYNPDSSLQSEGYFTDDRQDGIWKYFFKGKIQKKLTLKSGMANGPGWIYQRGILAKTGQMMGLPQKVMLNGNGKEYHPNGKISRQGTYMMNKKAGHFQEYHKNGNLMSEGDYMNDKKNGIWKFYGSDGKTMDRTKSGYYMMGKLNKKLTPKNF